ncbi:MAG: PLDc N-terminal domain-containing protein [Leptospira sp.]|nr:PLDc N-terminal domain-containing protein [Leptospira sp.]
MTETHNPGFLALLFNFYGYYLPFILYAVWAPLALFDLSKRQDMEPRNGILWTLAILVIPFLGAGAYHIAGGSKYPSWLRNSMIWGGTGALVLIILISSFIGY